MSKSDLQFVVNTQSPIAVYVQIENQVRFIIASGQIKAGEALPSVRQMSAMLDVNPNTVTKAYRDLELMQLVTTERGVGVTVADKAPKNCRAHTLAMVEEHLKDAVAECVAAGMAGAACRKIVSEAITSGRKPYTG